MLPRKGLFRRGMGRPCGGCHPITGNGAKGRQQFCRRRMVQFVTTGRLNKSGESTNLVLPSCVRMALSVRRSVGQFVRTILSLFLTDLLPVQKCRLGKRFIQY